MTQHAPAVQKQSQKSLSAGEPQDSPVRASTLECALRRRACTQQGKHTFTREDSGAPEHSGTSTVLLPEALWIVCGRAVCSPYLPAFGVASPSKMPDVLPTQCPKEAPISQGNTAISWPAVEPRSF